MNNNPSSHDTPSSRTQLSALLKNLSKEAGIKLELDDRGICAVKDSDDILLVLEAPEDDPMIYMYMPLLNLPPVELGDFYRTLLVANNFSRRTFGGTLGLDPDTNTIIFSYLEHPERLDSNTFPVLLAHFRDAGLELLQELSQEFKEYLKAAYGMTPEELENYPAGASNAPLPDSRLIKDLA